MRCLKNLIKIIGFAGVIIIMGAFGNVEYNDAIGVYYSLEDFMATVLIGVVLIFPLTLMMLCERLKKEREDNSKRKKF